MTIEKSSPWMPMALVLCLSAAACVPETRDVWAGTDASGSDGGNTRADAGSAEAPDEDAGRAEPMRDAGRRGRDGGPSSDDAGAAGGDDAGAMSCRSDADCTGDGSGICDEGVCVHIAECPTAVERASCPERSTSARWCVGGRNKLAKLSRLLCTEEAVSVQIFEVGGACDGTACTGGRTCESRLTGTGRAFCGLPCTGDAECPAGDACLAFSTGSYCGHPIGGVEDVFCSTTNVDGLFGPAFAAPRFFDATGAPITIRGDLQEVLDLDPSVGCP